MAKRQESWLKKAAEEAESFLSGARGAERAFTRVKSEKQGPKDTESRGGVDVVQYQSLHDQQQQWRGDPSPRDRTELATVPMNESLLMKSESGGGMMMAQPQQQQTRASFWQAFARTTSENQLGLLQSRAQAVVCTDLRGNITSWNQGAESLYQWKAEEVLGLNIVEILIPPNLRKAAWEVLTRVRYGESWSGLLLCKRKDGGLLERVFTKTPIINDEHHVIGVIAIDVSTLPPAKSSSTLKQSSLGKEEGAVEGGTSGASLLKAAGSESPPIQTSDESPGSSLLSSVQQILQKLQVGRASRWETDDMPKRQNSWDSEHELMSPDHLPEHQQTPNGSSHNSMQKNELQSGSDAKSIGAVGAMNFQQAEEDYQLQLAIALRVAAEAAAVDDPGLSATARGLHGNTRKMPGVHTVEATAYRFWVSNCLGYDDRIEDGFYEVWGMSPYVWSMCTDNNELGRIPPLAALQSVNTSESFEVVLVDRNDDPDLRDLEDKAVGLAYDCQEVLDLATRLAQMVADFMGGAAASDNELLEAWHANTTKMTQRIGSIVLPIGVLRPGLGRHRALLFKVMADSVGLPCRLVRGRSFSGKEEGALVVVKVGDDREWMVDLLANPGKIMAPDARLASPPTVIASPLQFERPSSFATSSILNWRDEFGLRDLSNSGGEAGRPNSELAASSSVPVAKAAAADSGKVGHGHSPHRTTQQANDASPGGGGGMQGGNRYNEDYHARPSGLNQENAKGRVSGDASMAGQSENADIGRINDKGVSSSPEEDSSRYSRQKLMERAVAFAKEYEIPWEDLIIGEPIGQGSYGKVYRADWQGSDVAVKVFLDQHVKAEAIEEFKAEVAIMQRLRHPNVVLFMGAVTNPPNLSIITEFCPRGSLYRLLHRPNRELDEKRRLRMALDVAKGMNYLHRSSPPVVHRDLKSPNLLVDKNWTVKVSDFGLSRLKHNAFLSSKSSAGTPEWMAPEVLRNELSDEKSDVYSFGVILWELSTLQQPWAGMNPIQVVGVVGFQHRRLPIPEDVDPAIANIIQACWRMDPRQRPTFSEIMNELKVMTRPFQILMAIEKVLPIDCIPNIVTKH
ncbi:unnamed protein product [Sphagnum compactum]